MTEQHCEKLYRRKQYRYYLCPADCVDLIVVDGPADEVEVIKTSNRECGLLPEHNEHHMKRLRNIYIV